MKEQKVKTKEEFKQVESYLVSTAVKTLGISERAAKLRVFAIIKSGILSKFGSPNEAPFQIAIDAAMQIPQLEDERVF